MDFSGRLRQLREGTGKTQHEIALEMDVKPENYNKWENGKSPNYETLVKIAEYHHCTTDYLLGLSDNKNEKETGLANDMLEEIYKSVSATYKNPVDVLTNMAAVFEFMSGYASDEVPSKLDNIFKKMWESIDILERRPSADELSPSKFGAIMKGISTYKILACHELEEIFIDFQKLLTEWTTSELVGEKRSAFLDIAELTIDDAGSIKEKTKDNIVQMLRYAAPGEMAERWIEKSGLSDEED